MDNLSDVSIAHLAEHQESVPTLAAWALAEWGHLSPGLTHAQLAAKFECRAAIGSIPETFVAVTTTEDVVAVVGMASIVENDLATRPDLTPWMASVYVDRAYRNRGVGSQLVRAIMVEAAALDVHKLYLITHDRMTFYRRLGWTPIERVHYRGEDVTIMVVQLNHVVKA